MTMNKTPASGGRGQQEHALGDRTGRPRLLQTSLPVEADFGDSAERSPEDGGEQAAARARCRAGLHLARVEPGER